MKNYPVEIGSWEDTRSKALKKIKSAAEDSDSEVLEEISEEADPKKRAERSANCEAVRMIIDKCLEDYREGEYEFPTTVEMICKALKAIK